MNTLDNFLVKLWDAQQVYKDEQFGELPDWFDEAAGICDNLVNYSDELDMPYDQWRDLRDQLTAKFARSGLDIKYPFNTGGQPEFLHESKHGGLWYNPARLTWLLAHVRRIKGEGDAITQ